MKQPAARIVRGLIAAVAMLFASVAFAAPQEFTLPAVDAGAKPFTLSEARGKYVALHFLLRTECPYCIRHVRSHFVKGKGIPDLVTVFIKPDSPEEIAKWAAKVADDSTTGQTPVIYRDAGAELADAFEIPGGYKFHGLEVHYPALVLLGPDGKEVFRYVGKNNSDRFSADKLAAKIAELKGAKGDTASTPLAIEGYDPVTYLGTTGLAKGSEAITAEYEGRTYRFVSEENRATFSASPAKVIPQYDAQCAKAVASNYTYKADPANFRITEGRVFVFYKDATMNTREDWDKDPAGMLKKADANWPGLKSKK